MMCVPVFLQGTITGGTDTCPDCCTHEEVWYCVVAWEGAGANEAGWYCVEGCNGVEGWYCVAAWVEAGTKSGEGM